MIEILLLLFAIPLGFLLSKVTRDERAIYTKAPYFPVLLWVFAFVAAIYYSLDRQIALTLTFIFITTFVWNRY